MIELNKGACEPCRAGAPTLTDTEISGLKHQIPQWKVVEKNGVRRIERAYDFPDFVTAMTFAVQIGELAETEGHHPDLHVSWGKVVIETWTHKISGLHLNDFVLAAKIDEIYESR